MVPTDQGDALGQWAPESIFTIYGPQTDKTCRFLGPEIIKVGQQSFWTLKLTLWVSFWAQKLILWARETLR
jgi:hypothetical protein